MERVDAHCHLWDLDRGDYDWLDASDPALKQIARSFDASDLAKVRKHANINRAVVVQAAETLAETEFLLSLADENTEIAGVVGWIDLSHQKAMNWIEQLSSHKAFKGIRPMLQDMDNTNWLIDVPTPEIWKFLVKKNLRLDALVRPRHLPMLSQFCIDNPTLPVVIDHGAKPELGENDPALIQAWMSDIAFIAKETNAYCKVSGLLTEMNETQLANAHDVLKPVIDHLIMCFGPDRLMWGSDWPVVRMAGDYDIWNSLTMDLLKDCDQHSLASILGDTATKFYGLEENPR